MGAGTDSERYRARVSAKKTVRMGDAECEYPAAYLTALLYTKGARGYPDLDKDHWNGSPEYQVWPYGMLPPSDRGLLFDTDHASSRQDRTDRRRRPRRARMQKWRRTS